MQNRIAILKPTTFNFICIDPADVIKTGSINPVLDWLNANIPYIRDISVSFTTKLRTSSIFRLVITYSILTTRNPDDRYIPSKVPQMDGEYQLVLDDLSYESNGYHLVAQDNMPVLYKTTAFHRKYMEVDY